MLKQRWILQNFRKAGARLPQSKGGGARIRINFRVFNNFAPPGSFAKTVHGTVSKRSAYIAFLVKKLCLRMTVRSEWGEVSFAKLRMIVRSE